MTADELRAKFEAWYPDAIGDVQPFECYMKGYASRDAEVEALRDLLLDRDAAIEMREHEVEASRKDVERVNHLALHPRGAKIVIAGMPRDCIFWGISSAPCYTLREAIDAEMQEKQP